MNINYILDNITPKTLAKLAVVVSNAMEDNEDFEYVSKLSCLIFDAGVRNCGDDFTEQYFEAVINNE